ncbi:vesicle transport protein SFT2B isoform X3 [Mangifera indica]|uniref:vesicle transport protein SFT2B isoform X3 n=1 Tax=Mangifera indica TaxID=29780 RepID=UPI001CF979C7|nr:vesicle transport protein SFT2B isoform X3 [Mangifera indica]
MEKVNHAFEKVKMLVGIEVEDEESEGAAASENSSSFAFMDDFNRQCTLSTKQRMYGFAICLSAGLFCTLLSLLVFFNPIKFGITFTFGNLLSLGSTAFLIGPKRQVHNKLLTLIAIILEFGALIWYSLSYIPFARTMVSKVMVACFDTEF